MLHLQNYRVSPLLLLSLSAILCGCNGDDRGPTAAQRRAAMEQGFVEQLANERQTVHITDSLLQVIIPQINAVTTQNFDYEKTEYDDLGHYRPKGSDPGDNVQRTYLRSAVDEYGRTQLIVTYCGSKQFCVVQLRVSAADGTSSHTRSIAPNDGSNYSYDIDGTHYQSVTFAYGGNITQGMTQDSTVLANADTDNGALAFIAAHADDDKLQCVMLSADGREQRLPVSVPERKQLQASYELGVMLRELTRLNQENRTAALKVEYLQTKVK